MEYGEACAKNRLPGSEDIVSETDARFVIEQRRVHAGERYVGGVLMPLQAGVVRSCGNEPVGP